MYTVLKSNNMCRDTAFFVYHVISSERIECSQMIIVLVVDTFIGAKRGIPLTAQKLYTRLTEAGHEVRVVACGKSTEMYRVGRMWLLYFTFMGKWQGITYGRPDEEVLQKAFEGADLVHIMLPFPLEKKAEFIARKTEVPVIASFAANARGFLNIAGIGWFTSFSGIMYRLLRFSIYKKCKNIICHSREIFDDLHKYKYPSKLHLIDESEFDDAACIPKLEAAYSQAITDDRVTYSDKSRQIFRRNWAVFPSSIDVAHPYKKLGLFFRGWYTWTYAWIVALSTVVDFIAYGIRIEGHRNLRLLTGGAVTVSNHVHNVDSTMLAVALSPKRITFTSIEGNFKLPVVRWLIKWVGVVPIPTSTHALRSFFDHTIQHLKDGHKVHFYPEGSLWQYYTGLRPFKKGAFHMAIAAGVPVLPVVLAQRPVSGLRRLFRKKPLFSVIICPPLFADPALSGAMQVADLRDRTHTVMCKALENNQYILQKTKEMEPACADSIPDISPFEEQVLQAP